MARTLPRKEARRMNSMRKTFGGPAKVLMPRGWCRQEFSAREIRAHFKDCPLKPAATPA